MERLVEAVGRETRSRSRAFPELAAPQPARATCQPVHGDRRRPFFRATARRSQDDAASIVAGKAELGTHLPISCILYAQMGRLDDARELVRRLRTLTMSSCRPPSTGAIPSAASFTYPVCAWPPAKSRKRSHGLVAIRGRQCGRLFSRPMGDEE